MSNMIFNSVHVLFLQRNTSIYYNPTIRFYLFKRANSSTLFYFYRRYRNCVSIFKANYILKFSSFLYLYILSFFLICQSCMLLYRIPVLCIRNKNYNYNMTNLSNIFYILVNPSHLTLFFKFPRVNSYAFF
jgi:hypothetical protein